MREVLEDEVVEDVWTSSPDEDSFRALVSTGNNFYEVKIKVPSGKTVKKAELKVKVPEAWHQIKASVTQDGALERLYVVSNVNGNYTVTSQSLCNKSLHIGQVQLSSGLLPLFDFNQEMVVKIYRAVSGNNKKGQKIYVTSTLGSTMWAQKVDRERPITGRI